MNSPQCDDSMETRRKKAEWLTRVTSFGDSTNSDISELHKDAERLIEHGEIRYRKQ